MSEKHSELHAKFKANEKPINNIKKEGEKLNTLMSLSSSLIEFPNSIPENKLPGIFIQFNLSIAFTPNIVLTHEKPLEEKGKKEEIYESIMEELRFLRREMMELKTMKKH